MTNAWYRVLSLSFGYLSCAIIVICALLALRRLMHERRILRRVRKSTPAVGRAGTLRVLTAVLRRIPAGTQIRVPYEGTMCASHSCDVCIPYRKVHMRSAFFWMERDGLHMVALHRDGFVVDEVPVEPGDEAILEDGATLQVGDVKLVLRMKAAKKSSFDPTTGPYVTTQRRSRAQKGYDDGIGAPGKGEIRREKKREEKKRSRETKLPDKENGKTRARR